ncbi:hypothetical protein N7481_004336 [Penicillium waksmanii]|uniref:uncharacterized protein n=1 Tax=Penicillium waksmanii TaxID=69791 RepID=UPI0025484F0E|nr:uncharacterized protein N7481_004336 [Penicillium waksmanii]KAJ5989126.1 hypothetical protein N7481_004336 [Penicillium waksmanii]
MPRTRASAPAKAIEEMPEVEQKKKLTTVEKPSKTFILPSSTSANARLLSLPNPQSGELTRYFFCPERGIYEFTVVASPTISPRSILFTPRTRQTTTASPDEETDTQTASIAKKAELLVATPIDSIFFLIALFNATSKSGQSLFQPLDDIIDSNDDLPQHLRNVLYDDTFRNTLLARAQAICDTVEAGDEKMLRFNEAKLLNELVAKADRLATQGLPASLEERFVRQPLAPPLMSVKREDALTGQVPSNGDASSKSEEGQDSPSTAATSTTPSVSTPASESTPAPQPPTDNSTSDKIVHLQRVSTALTFMKDSYLPASLCSRIDEMLASPESPLDFKPLTDRIKEIAALRAEALASRTLTDFSRKRGLDDEEVESRAEKKRKKDDEDKKAKAMESRGIRDLKKVNTTGMKKMSDFFGKAASKQKT